MNPFSGQASVNSRLGVGSGYDPDMGPSWNSTPIGGGSSGIDWGGMLRDGFDALLDVGKTVAGDLVKERIQGRAGTQAVNATHSGPTRRADLFGDGVPVQIQQADPGANTRMLMYFGLAALIVVILAQR